MKLTKKLLQIDGEATQQKIIRFIRNYVDKTKTKGIVLGVSGGVDSALTAALCTRAIGGKNVLGLYMPEKETYSKASYKHVELLAKNFRFQTKTINLTKTLDTLYKTIPHYEPNDKLSRGNLKVRIRMLTLYYYANNQNYLVAACSDKSETMIGYFTKWGDAAGDIAPIADLYKSQVRQLALHLGIPAAVATKPSTPALWPNQTAEEEIGMKYETLDLCLYGLEHFMSTERIAGQLHLPSETISTIKKRWLNTEHKRQMPITTKLEFRTINADFRLARITELEEQ